MKSRQEDHDRAISTKYTLEESQATHNIQCIERRWTSSTGYASGAAQAGEGIPDVTMRWSASVFEKMTKVVAMECAFVLLRYVIHEKRMLVNTQWKSLI